MQTSHNFTFTLQCCARYRNQQSTSLFPHSFRYSNIQVTYKPVSTSCTKINVWAEAPTLSGSTFSLRRTNGCPHTVKERELWICFFVLNQTIQLSFFPPLQVQYIVMDSVLSLLHSLSGSRSHPGSMNSASRRALSNSSANAMFGPAQHTGGGEGS